MERDGVLNGLVLDEVRAVMDSPLDERSIHLTRQAAAFVHALNERGYLALVVSEQPAVAQGRLSRLGLDRIHQRLHGDLEAAGARLDGIYVCMHDADAHDIPGAAAREDLVKACRCRRPAPGLLLAAASQHRVDMQRSYMICRDQRDVRAGRAAALETCLLTRAELSDFDGPADMRPHHVSPDLLGFVRILDAERRGVRTP